MAFKDLRGEIEEMFAEFAQRHDEKDDAYLERVSWLRQRNAVRMAVWRATHPVEYAEELARAAASRRNKFATDEAFREKQRLLNREYKKRRRASDPEFAARELEYQRQRRATAEFKAKYAAKKRAKYAEENATRLQGLASDPGYQGKPRYSEKQKERRYSPEGKAKNAAHSRAYRARKKAEATRSSAGR